MIAAFSGLLQKTSSWSSKHKIIISLKNLSLSLNLSFFTQIHEVSCNNKQQKQIQTEKVVKWKILFSSWKFPAVRCFDNQFDVGLINSNDYMKTFVLFLHGIKLGGIHALLFLGLQIQWLDSPKTEDFDKLTASLATH